MAYGLKYSSSAYGLSSVNWKVEIYEKDFTLEEGELPIDLRLVGEGLRIGYDREEDRFNVIYSRYAIVDLKVTDSFNLDTLQFDDERKFLIKIYRDTNHEFSGWIIPNYSSQAYEDTSITTITIQAKDSINRLRDIPFADEYPLLFSHKQSVTSIISQALRNIGYNLDLEIYYNKYEDGMLKTSSDCPLSQLFVNIRSFKENEEWINYYDIIQKLLTDHDLRIFQASGKWIIISPIELVDGSVSGRKFNYLGVQQSNVTLSSDIGIGADGLGIKRNSIIRKGIPIQSFTAKFEFGQSRNLVFNGELDNIVDYEPEGWTLSSGWENGEILAIEGGGIIFDNTYATRSSGINPDVPINDASLNKTKYLESPQANVETLGTFSLSAEVFTNADIDAVRVRVKFYNEGGTNEMYVTTDGKLTFVPTSIYMYNNEADTYKLLSLTWNNVNQYGTPIAFDYMRVSIFEGIRLRSGVPVSSEVKYRNIKIAGRPLGVSGEFVGKKIEIINTELPSSKKYTDVPYYYKDAELFNEPEHIHKLYLSDEVGEADVTTGKWKRTSESIERKLIDSRLVDRLAMSNRFGDIFEGSIFGYIGMGNTPFLEIDEKRLLVLYSEYSLGLNTSEIVAIELFANDFTLNKKEYNVFSDDTVIEVDGDSVSTTKVDVGEDFEPITDAGGTMYGGLYIDYGIDSLPANSTDPRATNKGTLLLGAVNAERITLGNRENNTLVDILGRLGIRNASNFLGEFSVADLTANRVATLPDRNIEINKWADLSGVPTSFTPSTHFHEIGEVNGLSVALADKQPLNGNLTSLGTLSTNGIVRRSGVNTFVIGTNDPITLSGDVTGSGTTAITTTLTNSGVTAGTYKSVTVDAKGRVTNGTNPTTIAGYGITDFNSSWDSRWNTTKAAYINFGASIEITQNLTVNEDLYVNGAFYDTALSSGSNNQFLRANGSGGFFWTALSTAQISNFSTNVLGQVLTGLTTGSNTPISSSNTILTGFQNLQAQISANTSAVSGTTNYIPKFTSASAIGNSTILDDGSTINIGDIAYLQDIIGGRRVNLNYPVYFGNSRMYDNTGEDGFNVLTVDTGTLELDAENVNVIGRLDISENILSLAKKKYVSSDTWYASIDALYSELVITSSKSSFVGSVGVSVIEGINSANVTANNLWNFSTIPQVSNDATLGNQLVRLSQVQSLLSGGFSVSTACKLVFIDNQSLSGSKTQGGYTTVTGDSILLTGQSSASANGVYTFDGTNWTRNTANDSDTEIRGKGHLVTNGTYASTQWVNNNSSTITVGSTAITYVQWSGSELDPVFTAHAAYNVTNTKISNWDTAYSWGNHTTLYVDKVSTQSDIGGAKTFTTSVQSPVLRAGSGSLIISLFNYFGNTPRVASSGNTLDFFANTNFTWTTTGDLTQMRLTATGLVIGGFTNDGYKLQVRGTSAFGGLINVVNPLTGSYSSGTDGQVLMRKTLSVLNYNEWTTLTVSHISDIATYYQAKITGTTNYLIKKTSTNVGDSSVYDDGTNVVIGGTSAIDSAKFSVVGKIGASTLRIGDNTDGINIGSLAISSTGALGYNATSHAWSILSTEKLNLNSTRLALTGDFELTGRLKVGGSFGADHYFLKSNGTTQEFAEINCGEISDISDLYLSKVEADANFVKRVTDEGDRGFFLYGDAENTIKEGFMFSNPDTGILGLHAFRLNGTTVEQYGLQLDKNGLPYWLFTDGSRKRILTENDILGNTGGGTVVQYTLAEPLYFLGTQINIRTATASQTGVLSFGKFAEFEAKLGQRSTITNNNFLNFATGSQLYFGQDPNNIYSADARISVYDLNGTGGSDLVVYTQKDDADIILAPNTGKVVMKRVEVPLSTSTMFTEVEAGAVLPNSILKFNGTNINWKLNTTPTDGQKFLVQYDSSKNTFFFVPA